MSSKGMGQKMSNKPEYEAVRKVERLLSVGNYNAAATAAKELAELLGNKAVVHERMAALEGKLVVVHDCRSEIFGRLVKYDESWAVLAINPYGGVPSRSDFKDEDINRIEGPSIAGDISANIFLED